MRWLDRDRVTVKRKDYESIENVVDVYEDPWSEPLLLDGTDGMG